MGAVDFHRNGPLQQMHGENQALLAIGAQDEPFKSGEGPELDADPFAFAQIRPRGEGSAGVNHLLNRRNFVFFDGRGLAAESDNGIDPGGGQNREAM